MKLSRLLSSCFTPREEIPSLKRTKPIINKKVRFSKTDDHQHPTSYTQNPISNQICARCSTPQASKGILAFKIKFVQCQHTVTLCEHFHEPDTVISTRCPALSCRFNTRAVVSGAPQPALMIKSCEMINYNDNYHRKQRNQVCSVKQDNIKSLTL